MPTLRKATKGGRTGGPRKEAYFVRVETPDGKPEFCNATDQLGQPMPFTKPQATIAMRASAQSVVFSFLQLTKKTMANIVGAPMELPRGPLAKLERKAASLELGDDEVIVEIAPRRPPREPRAEEPKADEASSPDAPGTNAESGDAAGVASAPGSLAALLDDEPTGESASDNGATEPVGTTVVVPDAPTGPERYRMRITRDENGVASLEQILEDGEEEDILELPFGALRLSLYLRSPVVGRTLAVGFIGFPGKPGNPDTIVRLTSMVLFGLSQLVEFRILSGIETVEVPAPPSRWSQRAAGNRPEDQVAFSVPVFLFDDEAVVPVARGEVAVEVDLRNANPSSARLLFHFHPSEEIAPHFDKYRQVFELSISEALRVELGDDEIANITYDIVLGDVAAGTVERIRSAAAAIPAYDLTPTRKRPHDA